MNPDYKIQFEDIEGNTYNVPAISFLYGRKTEDGNYRCRFEGDHSKAEHGFVNYELVVTPQNYKILTDGMHAALRS